MIMTNALFIMNYIYKHGNIIFTVFGQIRPDLHLQLHIYFYKKCIKGFEK